MRKLVEVPFKVHQSASGLGFFSLAGWMGECYRRASSKICPSSSCLEDPCLTRNREQRDRKTARERQREKQWQPKKDGTGVASNVSRSFGARGSDGEESSSDDGSTMVNPGTRHLAQANKNKSGSNGDTNDMLQKVMVQNLASGGSPSDMVLFMMMSMMLNQQQGKEVQKQRKVQKPTKQCAGYK